MKHLRTDAEAFLHFLIDPGIAVLWIPGDRVSDGSQVGADLVGSSGNQMNLQKGISISRYQRSVCSPDRQTSRGLLFSDRHLIRLFIFRQPSLDPGFAFYDSPHDADIIFSQTPVLDDLGHDLQSRQGTSSCHDAACVAVEAVADGRAEARQVLFL